MKRSPFFLPEKPPGKQVLAIVFALLFLVLLTVCTAGSVDSMDSQTRKAMTITQKERNEMAKDPDHPLHSQIDAVIASRMAEHLRVYVPTMVFLIAVYLIVCLWCCLKKVHLRAFFTPLFLLMGGGVSYKFLFPDFPSQALFTIVSIIAGAGAFFLWRQMGQQISKGLFIALLCLTAGLVLLLFTPLGVEINGSTNWISLFGITVQPSEFVKLFLVILGACAYRSTGRSIAYCIVTLCCCLAMALLNDLGSCAVLFAVFVLTTYILFDNRLLSLGVIMLGCIALCAAILVSDHAMERLAQFGNAMNNPNSHQQRDFLIAAVTGGLQGLGFQTAGQFTILYAASTDASVAGIGIVFGIGMLILVMGCYGLLILQTAYNSSIVPTAHPILFQTGTILFVQVILNYLGSLDCLPFTGITAPFLSTGGSSTVAMGILMGLVAASLHPKVQNLSKKGRSLSCVLRSANGI